MNRRLRIAFAIIFGALLAAVVLLWIEMFLIDGVFGRPAACDYVDSPRPSR